MTYELNSPLTEREKEIGEELRSRTNIANTIASRRIDLGLTQDELGRGAGTKQSRISEIESLQGNVRFDTLDRIARALGLMITLVPRTEIHAVTETTARSFQHLMGAQREDFAFPTDLLLEAVDREPIG